MKRKKPSIKFRPELFWDIDVKTLDPDKYPQYVIERILDFGRDEEVRWMWRHYPKSLISKTIFSSRAIFPETKSLWREILKTS